MPDATWETVSASQAPALFGHSPYVTKWMLWHAFKTRDRSMLESPDDNRMRAGRLLQHFILAETADRFRLEMVPNVADAYERRGRLVHGRRGGHALVRRRIPRADTFAVRRNRPRACHRAEVARHRRACGARSRARLAAEGGR